MDMERMIREMLSYQKNDLCDAKLYAKNPTSMMNE